jgi:hypothetical protein
MLTLESGSVVNVNMPASGAFVDGVNEGPPKIVSAWQPRRTARIAAATDDKINLPTQDLFDKGASRNWTYNEI